MFTIFAMRNNLRSKKNIKAEAGKSKHCFATCSLWFIGFGLSNLKTIMEKEQELWKSIKGYSGFYEISSLGRVRILGGGLVRNDRILKAKHCVNLSNGFNERKFLIEDMVADAFPNLTSVRKMKKRIELETIALERLKRINKPIDPVTIIERTDELLGLAEAEEIEQPTKPRKLVIGCHKKDTKGKWFNP